MPDRGSCQAGRAGDAPRRVLDRHGAPVSCQSIGCRHGGNLPRALPEPESATDRPRGGDGGRPGAGADRGADADALVIATALVEGIATLVTGEVSGSGRSAASKACASSSSRPASRSSVPTLLGGPGPTLGASAGRTLQDHRLPEAAPVARHGGETATGVLWSARPPGRERRRWSKPAPLRRGSLLEADPPALLLPPRLQLRPSVLQGHRPVEHGRFRRGIRVHAEVAQPLELYGLAHRHLGQ